MKNSAVEADAERGDTKREIGDAGEVVKVSMRESSVP